MITPGPYKPLLHYSFADDLIEVSDQPPALKKSFETLDAVLFRDFTKFNTLHPDVIFESFSKLCDKVKGLLKTDAEKKTLYTIMAIHNLGKLKGFQEKVFERSRIVPWDHDDVLLHAFIYCPDLIPSFMKLPLEMRRIVQRGWTMRFKVHSYLQAEYVPHSLRQVSEELMNDRRVVEFFYLHEILDGTLTENTLFVYLAGWTALGHVNEEDIYNAYLAERAVKLNLNIKNSFQRASVRLSLLYGCHDRFSAARVISWITPLLSEWLNVSGFEGRKGIVIVNISKILGQRSVEEIKNSLNILEKIFMDFEKHPDGVGEIIVDLSNSKESNKRSPPLFEFDEASC
jgi:hypothetical protein